MVLTECKMRLKGSYTHPDSEGRVLLLGSVNSVEKQHQDLSVLGAEDIFCFICFMQLQQTE